MFHSQELVFANNLGSIIVSHSPNCPEPEEEKKTHSDLAQVLSELTCLRSEVAEDKLGFVVPVARQFCWALASLDVQSFSRV
jgi:hypothetical protein